MNSVMNPLLQTESLPKFSAFEPQHVEPAIDQVLADNRTRYAELLKQQDYTWDNLIAPIETMEEHLGRAFSPVSHLNSVADTDALREAYNAVLPKLSAYGVELGQNSDLFAAYQSIKNSEEFEQLDTAQQRLITEALRDFQMSGVNLPEEEQKRFKTIQAELSQLSTEFSEHVLDATNTWTHHITDESDLAGIPDNSKAMFAQTAQAKELDGWLITLQYPSYIAVMTYADNRELRAKVYLAFATRASELGPEKLDNTPLVQKIVALKQEKAQLLGFNNYAELSLDAKMAESPDSVAEFLRDLASKAKPAAERDIAELKAFAKENHIPAENTELEAWDIAYTAEKLKQARYAISDEDLRPYFPLHNVIDGLFDIVQRLYGIQIEATDADVWHDDVQFFTVRNAAGDAIGQFYLDTYAREHKRGGAWMDVCRSKLGDDLPVAYLTCNATPPVGDKPALLSHDEVITLFHEFGHGLHHMLTTVSWPSVGGISGVEWDAVELPSQLMENWCWERQALDCFAKHYQTNETIPDDLFDRMIAAKNFQSGLATLRQVEFALFDLLIHQNDMDGSHVRDILLQVREEISVMPPPDFNRFETSFSHIFAGGYAAGYYSYKWAEVLAADAFAAFEESDVFDERTGQAFLQGFLSQGASKPAGELYRDFRGRDATIDALLRHSGLTEIISANDSNSTAQTMTQAITGAA